MQIQREESKVKDNDVDSIKNNSEEETDDGKLFVW